MQGLGRKHCPTPCCFAEVFQQDLLLFCDWEHSWEGGNVGLWWLWVSSSKARDFPSFLEWSHICHGEQSCSSRTPGQSPAQGGMSLRDISRPGPHLPLSPSLQSLLSTG